MEVRFSESDSSYYRDRTVYNVVHSDATVAFAFNLDSPGEKLTRNAAYSNRRPYCAVQLPFDRNELLGWDFALSSAEKIARSFGASGVSGPISLNVAGNGITSVKPGITQEDLDIYMARTLLCLERMVNLASVRSGGQTGLDEAGVKAASALGIPSEIYAPKGWRMRTIGADGRAAEVYDRSKFIGRFDQVLHLEPLALIRQQLQEMGMPDAGALNLFLGQPVSLNGRILSGVSLGDGLLELDASSSGVDRLWIGDDTLADYLNDHQIIKSVAVDDKEKDSLSHDIYYVFKVGFSEYMSDSVSYEKVVAKDAEAAERVVLNKHITDLVYGSEFPEIYSSIVDSVVIDGCGYNLTEEDANDIGSDDSLVNSLSGRKPDFLNIWYSSGENAILSNFYPRECSVLVAGRKVSFASVEQGFQYLKTLKKFSEMPDDRREEIRRRIMATTDGTELKRLGRSVPGLNMGAWVISSSNYMKELLHSAFANDSVGREALLATGQIRLTHLQENGAWGRLFPELLMKERASLRMALDTGKAQQLAAKHLSGLEGNAVGGVVDSSGPCFYEGDIRPSSDVVYVFGSNVEGRHGLGAAKTAREQFGAVYGQGEGLQGSSYGIPTKDLRVTKNKGYRSVSQDSIIRSIATMYAVARSAPEKKFMVAYRNGPMVRSLSGYSGSEMISMFLKAGSIPSNVYFSSEWKSEMQRQMSSGKCIRF